MWTDEVMDEAQYSTAIIRVWTRLVRGSNSRFGPGLGCMMCACRRRVWPVLCGCGWATRMGTDKRERERDRETERQTDVGGDWLVDGLGAIKCRRPSIGVGFRNEKKEGNTQLGVQRLGRNYNGEDTFAHVRDSGRVPSRVYDIDYAESGNRFVGEVAEGYCACYCGSAFDVRILD
ncbi:hypothetical protein K504DRAFT_486509 [Pleomassaria siparia CBS 279.74]|uniref:Uncharacterized protein n=1 Tax=Pleomassaria siparia CBS 279.74 TaxID=1314801 RepID=A0A6G1KP93_9PLEO|nr:hypothetical protein K504DRAFT_486509 [Pleomassaria siparia CBS 279.74]